MKKFVVGILMASMILILTRQPEACVGKILYIGVPDSIQEQLLAEMISVLATERTGTTVKILQYKDPRELYNAVKQGKVGMMIENTDRALEKLQRQKERSVKAAIEIIKKEYRSSMNMVWLDPYGVTTKDGMNLYYAPVMTVETLSTLPALPKLISKLNGILTEETFTKLAKAAKSDDKPHKVAKDFLKAKKLI